MTGTPTKRPEVVLEEAATWLEDHSQQISTHLTWFADHLHEHPSTPEIVLAETKVIPHLIRSRVEYAEQPIPLVGDTVVNSDVMSALRYSWNLRHADRKVRQAGQWHQIVKSELAWFIERLSDAPLPDPVQAEVEAAQATLLATFDATGEPADSDIRVSIHRHTLGTLVNAASRSKGGPAVALAIRDAEKALQ